MSNRKYDDDDGRTIVDMSGVGPGALYEEDRSPRRNYEEPSEEKGFDPRDYMPTITREERRWYILGALKAALMIGGAFIVGLGLLVLLLTLLWA